ncbi:hypothetical protein [Desulfogranum mediterraneum]|uniref:hypothetical protein n=1 Tax=Desulfogranum mediterraneum TaxID=160661 RepID=UPI00041FE40E|nr:hypothetical protein [Desulfogranum mediterraneum]
MLRIEKKNLKMVAGVLKVLHGCGSIRPVDSVWKESASGGLDQDQARQRQQILSTASISAEEVLRCNSMKK